MREKLLERLRTLRKKAGFSGKELSLMLNHSEHYIYKIEKGLHFPSIEDLEKIAALCDSSLEELFYEDFDDYSRDKEFMNRLKQINKKGQDALLTFLVMLYNSTDKEDVSDVVI